MARLRKASNVTAAASAQIAVAPFCWTIPISANPSSIKEQMVEMAMNASGIRDTARVLHISPTTVIKELKKRRLTGSK